MAQPSNPVAIVTGSSGGLGKPICAELSKAGYTIAGISRSRPASNTAIEPVEPFLADLTDPVDTARIIRQIVDRLGPPALLVHNAGQGAFGPIEFCEQEHIESLFALNVGGFFSLVRAVLPHMRAAGTGRIVTITSLTGLVPVPYLGLYGATKAALHSLTLSLRAELRPHGIKVTAMAPGRFDTPFGERSLVGSNALDPPYGHRALEWLGEWGLIEGRETPADPADVALAIRAVVEQGDPPAEVVVGADALRLLEQRQELGSSGFEEYISFKLA